MTCVGLFDCSLETSISSSPVKSFRIFYPLQQAFCCPVCSFANPTTVPTCAEQIFAHILSLSKLGSKYSSLEKLWGLQSCVRISSVLPGLVMAVQNFFRSFNLNFTFIPVKTIDHTVLFWLFSVLSIVAPLAYFTFSLLKVARIDGL